MERFSNFFFHYPKLLIGKSFLPDVDNTLYLTQLKRPCYDWVMDLFCATLRTTFNQFWVIYPCLVCTAIVCWLSYSLYIPVQAQFLTKELTRVCEYVKSCICENIISMGVYGWHLCVRELNLIGLSCFNIRLKTRDYSHICELPL